MTNETLRLIPTAASEAFPVGPQLACALPARILQPGAQFTPRKQAALDAVKAWHFRPYLFHGEPVKVEMTFELDFLLHD